MTKRSTLTKQSSLILANKNESLTKYITNIKQKHEEDEDYATWDLSKPLPKLPLPELRSTLDKYLRCIKPILDESSYEKTESIVEVFCKPDGDGLKLQEIIKKAAEEKDNWAYEWWLNDMYMLNKQALPINSNPGMIFPVEHFADEDAHLKFAARLISGIMDYKLVIDAQTLPVDRLTCREKGQPLCMEQYYRLFTSYRMPGVEKDKLVDSNTSLILEPEHIVVICLNQIFVLEVVVNFTRLNEDQLFHQLKRIKKQAETDQDISATRFGDIGLLTSLPRDEWAKARAELMRESTNRDCLDMIERCTFIMCLDKKVTSDHIIKSPNGTLETNSQTETTTKASDENKQTELVDASDIYEPSTNGSAASDENVFMQAMTDHVSQMVHGCGWKNNSGNRWFDKTMQFIVSEDGVCGLNYEHSAAEGIVVIELSEHLFRYISEKRKMKLQRTQSIWDMAVPKKLRWKISDRIEKTIEYAKTNFDYQINELDLLIYKFSKFGKDFPKKIKMSPDSFIQLSLQFTYYKLYKRLCSTYESASTRRFRKGRVDNIRANSCEALEWVKSMDSDSKCTTEEKISLFRKAVQYQTDLMIQTILGYGMDCHINTLKSVAIENNMQNIDFVTDESFRISNHFKLSTSQIPTSFEGSVMCYGPVVHDGYGCAYNPKPDYILFAISSNNSCPETSSKDFAKALNESLTDIFNLFNESTE